MEPRPTYTTDAMTELADAAIYDANIAQWRKEQDATTEPATDGALPPELTEIDFDLDPELTEEQLSLIMQTWPWSMRDVMGRWLGGACTRAGITSKRQRHALQFQLMRLFGEA